MMRTILTFLLTLVLAGTAATETRLVGIGNPGGANLPSRRLGVDDLIAVSVYRAPELTLSLRVDASGAISLPLLEHPVQAAGLMPHELEAAIAEALKSGGILVNPVVTVTVAEYASRPISVIGAVNRPLTFQAVGRMTLLDALARAEGLAANAGQEVLVSLPGAGAVPLLRRIPVRLLIDEADPSFNLELTGGEEIRVPEAGRVFVVGNVKRPGAYPVPDPRDATVMKVLAMAEGLAPYSTKRAYIYREEPETGAKREIEIELARIMKRKSPDLPLEVNDVLYVPDASGKRATLTALDRALSFATGTVSGMLIWWGR